MFAHPYKTAMPVRDDLETGNLQQRECKLLIFDFDGVLVDTQEVINEIQYEYLKGNYNLHLPFELYTQKFSGMRMETIVGILQQQENFSPLVSALSISQTIDDLVLEQLLKQEVSPLTGVVQFLEESHIKRCIASNCSFKLLKAFLKASKLDKFFKDNVFSADMVKHPKPAPDLFLYAATEMSEKVQNCLVIEDSLVGIQAATAAGIRVIGFLGGSHVLPGNIEKLLQAGAETVINDMRQLTSYLNRSHAP
ncbi:HAD family hydrolase [Candidatus Odyssella acanthamoebae]|uniref:HAD family hydrolase n=1 Tax=Candidatus Odyssella acanthamoebae TaxID=91604 RepID=UPI00068D6251|nr:HAD family phosphatase [Candidatus Paracaedibacter acanthamoebae]